LKAAAILRTSLYYYSVLHFSPSATPRMLSKRSTVQVCAPICWSLSLIHRHCAHHLMGRLHRLVAVAVAVMEAVLLLLCTALYHYAYFSNRHDLGGDLRAIFLQCSLIGRIGCFGFPYYFGDSPMQTQTVC
jgi:hypothetical protein